MNDKYRIVGKYRAVDGQLRAEYFRIETLVRVWWKLFLGRAWVPCVYEAGMSGYYFEFRLPTLEEAFDTLEYIRQGDRPVEEYRKVVYETDPDI